MDEILWQEVYEQMLEMGLDEYSAEILATEQMEYMLGEEPLPGSAEWGEQDWSWSED